MQQQGARTRWEQAVEHKLSWARLWKAKPHQIKLLIQAVNNVLPSPSNLFCWGNTDSPACPLCMKRWTLEHIHISCSKALSEGRYYWRQVLKAIVDHICSGISHYKLLRPVTKTIAFVRTGEKLILAARTTSSGHKLGLDQPCLGHLGEGV